MNVAAIGTHERNVDFERSTQINNCEHGTQVNVAPKWGVVTVDFSQCLTYLDMSRRPDMAAIKISSKVEESAWRELRAIARESHQSIGGLLTEAIRDFVRRRRVRPEVLKHLDDSIAENEELGRLLAQ